MMMRTWGKSMLCWEGGMGWTIVSRTGPTIVPTNCPADQRELAAAKNSSGAWRDCLILSQAPPY